jgi:hypothetical protein
MRPRTTLTIVLCLLSVSTALPTSADEPIRERGRERLEAVTFWRGLVAWISQYGLQADPDGSTVSVDPGPITTDLGVSPSENPRPSRGHRR